MQKVLLAALAVMALAASAQAQERWPSRPVKLIVPFAAGGNTDAVGRVLANHLQTVHGMTAVVENRAGGGGIVGTDAVAKSPPDGYSICVCSMGPVTIASATDKLPYDPLNDLAPISMLTTNALILLVNADVKANSVQELIALSHTLPGGLNYSSSGNGGLLHFSAELFKAKTGANLVHVPYRGGALATTAVVTGEVQMIFANMSDAVGPLSSRKVRALAVTTSTRSPAAPDVPTMIEQGVAGFHTESWNALLAPKGTPQPIIDRLAQIAAEMAKDPTVQKQMENFGSVAVANTPAEFARQLREETDLWADVVKEMGRK
jgi:tripartite-type tricarboxylate transporter receptor subunit TctC